MIAVAVLVAATFAGLVILPAAAQVVPRTVMQLRYNAQHTSDYSPVAGSTSSNNLLLWCCKMNLGARVQGTESLGPPPR